MQLLQSPIPRIAFFVVCGIAFEHFLRFRVGEILLGVSLAFGFLFLQYLFSARQSFQKIQFGISVLAISFFMGALSESVHIPVNQPNNFLHLKIGRGKKHVLQVRIREKLKGSKSAERFICLVDQIDKRKTTGRILLNIRNAGKMALPIGTELFVYATIFRNTPPLNPGQFDYAAYLENKGITAQAFADREVIKVYPKIHKDIWYYSDQLRNGIIQNLRKSHFHESELQVLSALILGQQQEISTQVVKDYQYAGAVHILSVSGLHVGFLLLFLTTILRFLPKNAATSLFKLILTLVFLWGFAIIAGLSPSVVRSVTMFSFVAMGMHLNRSTFIFHTLFVSLLLILLVQPSFLFDAGFQLSYLALFFIVWLQPGLSRLFRPKFALVQYFRDILTVSFAAQIGTLPLSLYYFHQFPGLFFVTNLIIIPLVSLIMAIGAIATIWACFSTLPQLLLLPVEKSIWLLNKIIAQIASYKEFLFLDIPFNTAMMWGAYLLIISWAMWLMNPRFNRLALALFSIIIFEGATLAAHWKAQSGRELVIFNLKKSTVIATRKGNDFLVYNRKKIKDPFSEPILKPYLTANFATQVILKRLPNVIYSERKKILIIDGSAIFTPFAKPDILILSQSPKINLERLIAVIHPKKIVADASNSEIYLRLWKATTQKQKIPFHATAEKGYYVISGSP